ncbi:MAG: class F sortase, partial [Natronosporangium sp.]
APAEAAGGGMRARVLLAVGLLLVGVFGIGLALGQLTGPFRPPDWLSGSDDLPPGDALAPSRPTRIEIPALGLRAKIHPVGLDPDGAIAAPSMRRADEAGWYEDGPSPGQSGPAVIVGHVDDRDGPAVFHRLATLDRGTRIEIDRRDRQVATFQVTAVRSYDKAALPAREVYGDFSRPGLRLITCGGRWAGGTEGYAENVVIFATLVASRPG